MARLLAIRGVSAGELEGFLAPSLSDIADPLSLPGVREAVEAILPAVRSHGRIVVFGDYDCDGVCASAILFAALSAMGADAKVFLPERLSEGYGMNDAAVSRMLAENPSVSLVVTVDNGINSAVQVGALRAKGISVVVTDHHLPGDDLPACPLVNPKILSPAELDGLCGAGVALFVAYRLVARAKEEGLYSGPPLSAPLIVLAGLATVTDIMPLKGQNRLLVASALRLFRKFAPIGLKELFARASRHCPVCLTSKDFGFLLGPRVNAAGRMGSGMEALDLLLAKDREEARELARRVDLRNAERKKAEQTMAEQALSGVVPGAPAQVICLPDGNPGVAGIVAARILEWLSETSGAVPVCVAVGSRGSARAPDGYNVRDAFAACSEHLDSFGGHAAAGGFRVKDGRMDVFRRAFDSACAAQAAAAPRAGAVLCDAFVEGEDLSLEFVESLSKLEPFGEGNPEPVFAMRGVLLSDVRPLGADGKHLALEFRGRSVPRAVWWNHGERIGELRAGAHRRFDILFAAEVSTYGERHVELRLLDIRETPGDKVFSDTPLTAVR